MKTISVKVKPNARVSEIEALPDGTYHARLKSPPVEGKANKELMALVAKHFGRHKSQVSVKSGATSRLKRIQIDDQ